jgi:two-component system chemotaxis response regulator CheY
MAWNVLIVDDSRVMRAFIRKVITLAGIDVGECRDAASGEEALELLRAQWMDLILTDINMPGMNGEQLLECLQNDELLRAIPVIVVSTDASRSRVMRMLHLGAKGYIAKPFVPERLRDEVERVMRPHA